MKASRAESGGEATIVLHVNAAEETALRTALTFALETSFERLEVGVGAILEDEEQDVVTKMHTALWPNAKGNF